MANRARRVVIPSQPPLEGVLHAPAVETVPAGVCVCHPHPGYGGDMDQSLVVAMATSLAERGLWALRFNFRTASVESDAAPADLEAALDYLAGEIGRDRPLGVAGYSFGALVAVNHALSDPTLPPRALALVGLPLRFAGLEVPDLRPLASTGLPVFVVAGEDDTYGPPEEVRAATAPLGAIARLVVLRGADHFYWDRLDEVGALVADFMAETLARGVEDDGA